MIAKAEIKEMFQSASRAVLAYRLRAVLTTFGITIGIVTVSVTAATLNGINTSFHSFMSSLGSDVFYVLRFTLNSGEEQWKIQKRPKLTVDLAHQIETEAVRLRAVVPQSSFNADVKYRSHFIEDADIIGTTEEYPITSSINVTEGRFLTRQDVEGGRPVCVLAADLVANLFPNGGSIGEWIYLNQRPFQIVGILGPSLKFLGLGSDDQVIIPITQLIANFNRSPSVTLQVKAMDADELGPALEELHWLLRKYRHLSPEEPDNFGINTQEQFIAFFNRTIGLIELVGLGITSLSLLVGGVGIMNIMFVSVAERTREIGIRRSLGAKRQTILIQFLLEAMIIASVGGALGCLVSFPAVMLLPKSFPVAFSAPITLMALGIASSTGIVAGFIPAYRASRMNPIDALKTE